MAKTKETTQELAPRPEARPLAWDELSAEQQKAAQDACSLLRAIAKVSWEKPKARERARLFLPPIDEKRLNHVLLLDGGRGSGKTALLITLVDAWNQWVLKDARKDLAGEERLGDWAPIVPVGLVDLQPLPGSTNLLLHLVGQFQRLLEALEQHGAEGSVKGREASAWFDEAQERTTGSRAMWEAFLRAAASGWDGSLQGRRANLDPEAYAYEVGEAGRQRLDVVSCFRELMDELCEEYRAFASLNKGESPLFVVAVDDADMNPKRALELLDLVRTLWHPRVAFVLTGYSEMFEEVLRAYTLRELRRPLEGLHVPDEAWKSVFPSSDLAWSLATDIYEKAIPPPQRLKLSEITPEERYKNLKDVLEMLPVFMNRLGIRNLAEYFDLQPQANAVFPGRFRGLLDLKQDLPRRLDNITRTLERDGREKPWPGGELLRELCWSGRMEEAPEPSSTAWPPIDKAGAGYVIKWDPRQAFTVQRASAGKLSYSFQYGPPFRLTLEGENVSKERVAEELIKEDVTFSLTHLALGRRGFGVMVSFGSATFGSCRFAWPLPSWGSPFNYAAFLWLWNEVTGLSRPSLERALELALDLTKTAQWFIAAVLALIRLRRERAPQAQDAKRLSLLQPLKQALTEAAREIRNKKWSWDELAEQVAALSTEGLKSGVTEPERRWVLGEIGLLAAPECGLDAEAANEWLRSFCTSLGANWDATLRALVSNRRSRAAASVYSELRIPRDKPEYEEQVHQLLDEIDQTFAEHAWSRQPGTGRDSKPADLRLARSLLELFQSIDDVVLDPGGNIWTIAPFLKTERWKALVAQASSKLKRHWIEKIEASPKPRKALLLVTALWNDAVEAGEAPGLQTTGKLLTESAMSACYDRLGDEPWGFQRASSVSRIGPRVRTTDAAFGWTAATFRDSLSGPLYEFAWDVILGASDGKRKPGYRQGWWEAGGGARDGSDLPVYPWPAVDWTAFLDYHLLAHAWNQAYRKALSNAALAPDDEQNGDDLAFWFIQAVARLAFQRDANLKWESGISSDQWAYEIPRMYSENYAHRLQGERFATYAIWCRALPLFAAPESGLSIGVAEIILNAAFDGDIPPDRLAELKKLRHDRIAYRKPKVKAKGKQIETELRRIDDENPEHPWVKLIEKR
jgi:hypothetical protein